MRISTAQYYAVSSSTYQKSFADTAKTQEEISSGSRIQTAGDDPIGASQLLQLQQQSSLLGQYSTNMTTVTNSQNQEESVLDSINTAMQSAREDAVEAGGGTLSDADRLSISNQIGAIKQQVFGLLNSKDANGNYLFSGSKSSTPPYVENSDGSFTYQGDETQLSLQVSDTLSLATNDTGYAAFEQAANTSRTESTLTSPAVDDGVVALSPGQIDSTNTYNSSFSGGEPYTLKFTSSTQYTITDGSGNDVTDETNNKGVVDPNATDTSTISLRGVSFQLDFNLSSTQSESPTTEDTAIAGHTFTLQSTPPSVDSTRLSNNTSIAQLSGGAVTNAASYNSTFPSSGAIIKFTSATAYQVFAQPLTTSSKAIASGTLTGTTVTAAGATFNVSGTPAAGDEFAISGDSHQSQNILTTLSNLQTALALPVASTTSQLNLKYAVASALSNIDSASQLLDTTRGLIGARGNAITTQTQENTSLNLANQSTQQSIGETDMSSAASQLTLQSTMLQASQLAFAKISALSLFNKI